MNPSYNVKNHTTQAIPSDGATVFVLGQCQDGCSAAFASATIDLTDVNNTFTISLANQTWSFAILACIPNITIETREVRNDGQGLLSVQPLPAGRQLTRQGNLNPTQTPALFSYVTSSLQMVSVTSSQNTYPELGPQVMSEFLFGKAQIDALSGSDDVGVSVSVTPAPIENITQSYTQVIRSGAKRAFLDPLFVVALFLF